MADYAQETDLRGVEIQIGRTATRVRIPSVEFETDYFRMKEQLLSEVYRRPATTWIFDLSEHGSGVTLVLAGVLADLCEEARRAGCTTRCTGLQKSCEKCGAGRETAIFPAERTGREDWVGMTLEPTCLQSQRGD